MAEIDLNPIDKSKQTKEEKDEIERQEKLIRELHGIPEPEEPDPLDEQPPTPEAKEEDEEETEPKREIHPRSIMVSNLSKKATDEQIKTLFGFIGEIGLIKTFPKKGVACLARVAFIQFKDGLDAGIAIHLTNTIFIDRPITVSIWQENQMPNEAEGLKHITPLDANYQYGKTELAEVIKRKEENKNELFAGQIDDSTILDRSVHVSNLDPIVTSEIALVQFLAIAGAVEKCKLAGDEAYIVFKLQKAVDAAFKLNGATFLGKQLKIRPATDRDELMKRVEKQDKDDTLRRVIAAQTLIEDVVGAGTDEPLNPKSEVKRERVKKERRDRDRSRDRSRKRSRSRDRSRSRHKHKHHKTKKEYHEPRDRKRRRDREDKKHSRRREE